MKICTITCHDVYNHGASLQAYALMTYLKKCGNYVKIIDYKPDYLSNHYKLSIIANPKWEKNILTKIIYLTLKFPRRLIDLRRKRAFDKFTNKYLQLTDRRFTSNNDIRKNLPQADIYICGSDQIWNSLHKNGRDPAFYLDFVPDSKIKASYAASIATDSIANEYKKMVKSKVERLDAVGIREKSGVKIIKELGIEKAVQVMDPVFLLSADEWNEIGIETFNDDYILVYDFDKSSLIQKIALDIAKEKSYKIYTINSDNHKYSDKSFRFSSPEKFVSLVRDAKFVVSNSFHAVVLSLIYNKQFAIINRTEAINTRMRDLLEDMNLKDRLVNEEYKLNDILATIDYTKVNKILEIKIEESKKYLENLQSCELRG
ncbi:MAG: polysaccharide pyruvyl transferase family protein [Clostridium sp.]|uniref:polysaccharide pyruvyl transferase family protein n=1 Tax=Clostridium sp. TaxID=1506 RepID=UPI00399B032E